MVQGRADDERSRKMMRKGRAQQEQAVATSTQETREDGGGNRDGTVRLCGMRLDRWWVSDAGSRGRLGHPHGAGQNSRVLGARAPGRQGGGARVCAVRREGTSPGGAKCAGGALKRDWTAWNGLEWAKSQPPTKRSLGILEAQEHGLGEGDGRWMMGRSRGSGRKAQPSWGR